MRDIFQPRAAFRPFEYPEAAGYKDAISQSFWLVTEWNFQSDIQDFKVRLTDHQKQVFRDALLIISQVEVGVKKFWGNIGNWLPKPEIQQVGATFAESEVRHADAYSHLLQVLDLNEEFEAILEVECVKSRVEFLNNILTAHAYRDQVSSTKSMKAKMLDLTMFSLLVENVSLFAQFAIVKSFNKHLSVAKDVDNVVQATQKEETVHALFGTWVINTIKEEHPDWFDEAFYMALNTLAQHAYDVECNIIDFIFRDGDLEFITKANLKAFIASRLNESLESIGAAPVALVHEEELKSLLWFEEELHADTHSDFFHKRPVTYAKKSQPITAGDLF